MALSWNEIKDRALNFSLEWKEARNEEAEAKPFLVEFFNVFGISNRRVSTFEHRVKKLGDSDGYIDLLWKGTMLVEMKSRGKDLNKAYQQALSYTHGLKDHELPKYILTCDFDNFHLYDVEEDSVIHFVLKDLYLNVQHFSFMLGYQKKEYKEQDPANIKAAELMGRLHDRLEDIGYKGHALEVYLVRILFCLFAEDTTIFQKQQFQDYIEQRTNEDGSDLAARLQELFQVLNTPLVSRFKNLDSQLAEFPYVNGKLFEEILPNASFDSAMRLALLECCYMDWSRISPAIFGSMFQSVMNPQERRNLGAHYTSEKNIQKVLSSLFLEDLYKEFDKVKSNKNQLIDFHKKLSELKFLDPACGCGNFLITTYKELRLLEIEILRVLNKGGQSFIDIDEILWIDVDQFYGIEYEEFPARIAEVAMWLIDHQMNMRVSDTFGQYYIRLPLRKTANIIHGDALESNWQDVIQKERLNYIIGNPPFIGSNIMKQEQRNQIVKLFDSKSGGGTLDYVTGWYIKAAKYIQGTDIKCAFVSTNSIVQGEQTNLLWGLLQAKYKTVINFAHRTFKWSNEAKGNAAVYCVIIGFSNKSSNSKYIFEYNQVDGEPLQLKAKNINAYLIDAKDIFIEKRQHPICNVPGIMKGNYYAKSEGLIIEEEDLKEFLQKEPKAIKWIKELIGADEFINSRKRYCLWLVDCPPNELKSMPHVMKRVNSVKEDRLKSKDKGMQNVPPTRFRETLNPESCLVIPVVSSERRKYIPMGFIDKNTISTNGNLIIPNASMYHFGVLTSLMHAVWVKTICGRLKSDIRYSAGIVYNNFPWPEINDDRLVKKIEKLSAAILSIRHDYVDSSLGDLYDPLTMPEDLIKAHHALDNAVDSLYRAQPFNSDANRMEFLFDLYAKYTADLFTKLKTKPTRKK